MHGDNTYVVAGGVAVGAALPGNGGGGGAKSFIAISNASALNAIRRLETKKSKGKICFCS